MHEQLLESDVPAQKPINLRLACACFIGSLCFVYACVRLDVVYLHDHISPFVGTMFIISSCVLGMHMGCKCYLKIENLELKSLNKISTWLLLVLNCHAVTIYYTQDMEHVSVISFWSFLPWCLSLVTWMLVFGALFMKLFPEMLTDETTHLKNGG